MFFLLLVIFTSGKEIEKNIFDLAIFTMQKQIGIFLFLFFSRKKLDLFFSF